MNCSLCGSALAGFAVGLGALFTFIVFPVIEIIFALFRIIFDKIIALRND